MERQEERPAPPAAIDIERLAERVYQLLLAEVRLGQARGEALPRRERMAQ